MAHTNETPHFDLPQFLGTDKASWLGDINPAFLAIDTALFEVKTDSSDAASSAAAAQQSAQAAETSAELAQTQVETVTTEVAALKTKVDSQQTELGNLASGQTAQGASITQLQTDVQQAQTTATSAETQANAAQQTATQASTQATNAYNNANTANTKATNIPSFSSEAFPEEGFGGPVLYIKWGWKAGVVSPAINKLRLAGLDVRYSTDIKNTNNIFTYQFNLQNGVLLGAVLDFLNSHSFTAGSCAAFLPSGETALSNPSFSITHSGSTLTITLSFNLSGAIPTSGSIIFNIQCPTT